MFVEITESPAEQAPSFDVVLAQLEGILGSLGRLAQQPQSGEDAELIDQLATLEQIKAAAAAVQSAVMVRFAKSQVAAQRRAGVDYRRLGRGIADQIALALKVNPTSGVRRLTQARALIVDLPGCFDLLVRGEISEHLAGLVATETSHLDSVSRQQVDKQLVTGGVDAMGPREAAGTARRLAYQADPVGSLERGRKARADRRVTCRPAPDTMAILSALLPVEQGIQCLAALRHQVEALRAAGDPRSRDQIMADTLVERITGQERAGDLDLEIQLSMPVSSLLDPDDPSPADLAGAGPLPSWLAQDLLARARRRCWRRLFTAPAAGGDVIVGGDPQRRHFDGWLRS